MAGYKGGHTQLEQDLACFKVQAENPYKAIPRFNKFHCYVFVHSPLMYI